MYGASTSQFSSQGFAEGAKKCVGSQGDSVAESPGVAGIQEGVSAFGRLVKNVLEPVKDVINRVNPKKINMLEILASIASDGKPPKTNFDRIVYVIESVPNEKREVALNTLTSIFKANRVFGQKEAEDIKAQIRPLFESHVDFEVPNEIKASQQQQELLARQWTKERCEFLGELEKYVSELEPEWFEDRTVVNMDKGAYTVSIGYGGKEKTTDLCVHIPEGAIPGLTRTTKPVTFKAGVMHGTTIQKEVGLLISSLRSKELSNAECARLADYSTTRISISLGSEYLFSLYLLPEGKGVKMEILQPGENRLDLPANSDFKTNVQVNIEDQRVFSALSYCLGKGVEFCVDPMINLDNFLKYELITFKGEKQAFLDLMSLFLNARSAENISPTSLIPHF
ncbi:hypothetical protein J7438_16825 [Thalassotalea sp. G20_0]|uniref:hypothetical protein n=1 Tax=Thalassotalea sp. G20_0 TaxID=2821093 RepID=UPI001AD95459|nr:hypothetical protein [Thalassotalea sp. G20_0]MBO9495739.1 hypothetical protein [Thalassotalea sp. G20_0]